MKMVVKCFHHYFTFCLISKCCKKFDFALLLLLPLVSWWFIKLPNDDCASDEDELNNKLLNLIYVKKGEKILFR